MAGAVKLARPFAEFEAVIRPQSPLRAAITAACRRPEIECVAALLAPASLPPALARKAAETARSLVAALRAKARPGGVEGLVREYAL